MSESPSETGEGSPSLRGGDSAHSLESSEIEQDHVGGCLGSPRSETQVVLKRDMALELVTEDQQDWDPNDKTFSETEISPLNPPEKPVRESGENIERKISKSSVVSEEAKNLSETRRRICEETEKKVSVEDSSEGTKMLDKVESEEMKKSEEVKSSGEDKSSANGGRKLSGQEEAVSHVSSATNVTPLDSLHEEPEYEIPMYFPQFGNDHGPSRDTSRNSREPSRSPIYSTVVKPGRLKLSQSMTTRAGTLSPGSGVVSYASSVMAPDKEPVSDYPISKQYTLGWVPKVPKKQRCVQVQ